MHFKTVDTFVFALTEGENIMSLASFFKNLFTTENASPEMADIDYVELHPKDEFSAGDNFYGLDINLNLDTDTD